MTLGTSQPLNPFSNFSLTYAVIFDAYTEQALSRMNETTWLFNWF